MTLYGFRDRKTAENLKHIGETMNFNRQPSIRRKTGQETMSVKVTEKIDKIDEQTKDWESGPAVEVRFGTDGVKTETKNNVTVYNTTEEDVEADTECIVVRQQQKWVILPTAVATPTTAPKRVKFKLNDPLFVPAAGFSGAVTATVIDPMNSTLAIGDFIQVVDYQKQFEFTQRGSIGIAIDGDPFEAGLQWHIETCTQLITRIEIDLSGDLEPWGGYGTSGVPSATIVRSMSAYPDILWATTNIDESEGTTRNVNEGIGALVDELRNPLGIVAASGKAVAERRPIQAQVQDEDNQSVPYTVAKQAWYWAIVSCENEVADWARTRYNGTNFVLEIINDDDYSGGVDPTTMTSFTNLEISNPPAKLWNSFTARRCHVAPDEEGWAFLNKTKGKYMTMMTASSLYGLGEIVDVVADLKSEESQLVDNGTECGTIKYKTLTNVVVFGTDSSTSSCQMKLDPQPDIEVDVFDGASDAEVVTGLAIDGNGDLEMVKVTIKACTTPTNNVVLPLNQMDVVTDVSCGANGLTKSYKTVKYLGSELQSGGPVELPCTNPNNYDWEYIFNNHVYHEDWWNVNYYDITFPEGCDPCPEPTGCCTATAYPNGQDGITQADCEAETGYVSWTEGECGGEPTNCCDTLTVSQCDFGDPNTYTSGSGDIGHTQLSINPLGGCAWTVSGNWMSNFNGSTPFGTYSLTYDQASSTWSINGSVPSPYGGTVSGSLVREACTIQNNTVIDIPVSGTHLDFSGSSVPYNGTVRVAFTQTG